MIDRTDFYLGRQAVVTGGAGFLASYVIEALTERGASVRAIGRRPTRPDLPAAETIEYVRADLTNRGEAEEALRGADLVFHLAAVGWGFHENLKRQPELLTQNLILNSAVIDAARACGVERYLYTSSSAVYPAHLQELDEDAPWDRDPHEGEAGFGWAKRMGEIQARSYLEHYGLPVAIVRPSNPYGPRDEFDPDRSHVIPALIRRAAASEDPFVVWGTGTPVRSFVHARDVARGMLAALEHRADGTPINLASPEAVQVADLVDEILALCGHTRASIVFDRSRPDGAPRKIPSVQRQAELLGLVDPIPLATGLKETVEWYVSRKAGEG